MRKLQPQVVITFGPDGITGHPDHIAIGRAATQAFDKLEAPAVGARKLYYVTVPRSMLPDPGGMGITARPDDEVTTAIDIRDYLDLKVGAIEAHRSQRDALEFVQMLRGSRELAFASREFFYRARPEPSGKETAF
jgi:LmbE family N-acetylglucosaminyl deacetylase